MEISATTLTRTLSGTRSPVSRHRAPVSARNVVAAAGGHMEGLNKYSSRITQPRSQGASQAMLYATGLKEEDLNKPQARR